MKSKLSLLFALLLALSCTACSGGSVNMGGGEIDMDEDAFHSTMLWCTAGPEGRAQEQLYQLLANKIEEKTDGHIKVKVYYSAQLGTDQEIIENIQSGRVHGNLSTTAAIPYIVPAAAILDYPGALTDMNVVTDMYWNTALREELDEAYSQRGLYLGAMVACRERWLICDRSVQSMEDLKGLQIRTGNNIYQMAYFNAIGCSVTPLDFSEVPVALQQGLVNGLENPIWVMQRGNYHEIAPYMIDTQLSMYSVNVLLSKAYMESIPPKYKALIDEACEEAARESVEMFEREDAASRAIMEAEGTVFLELPEEMRMEMRERAVPAVESLLRRDLGDELVDSLLETYRQTAAQYAGISPTGAITQ